MCCICLHLLYGYCHQSARTKKAADTVAVMIGVPLVFSGTVIARIQNGGREKMILTMLLAVPLATGPTHTQAHTPAHTICVFFPSLEELRSRHMCLPELLLRKGSGRDCILVRENTVNFYFIRQHSHLLCMSRSFYLSIWLLYLHSHFHLCVWPGGGSPTYRGFSGAPCQTNHLSQVLRPWRSPNLPGTRHQTYNYMEGN